MVVAYVSVFNFMDEINGISAAQATVAGLHWPLLVGMSEGLPALMGGGGLLVGCAVGFAPFNFPKARVFLGDAGSYFLGAWIGALVVIGIQAGINPETLLAPLALYLADTSTTIIRRVRAGEIWYQPHRCHTYQQLIALGWSHTSTRISVFCVAAGSAAAGMLSLGVAGEAHVGPILAIGILTVAYLFAPLVIRHQPRLLWMSSGTKRR